MSKLKSLNCPQCGNPMCIRIKNSEHCNSANNTVKKAKYYQYYCPKCDNEDSGWTTTESDELSLSL